KTILFNEAQLLEDEKYDGYYSIVTSEKDMSDEEVIETYRGLWEIEETFKISKSTLEARPVYLSRNERIQAHFLTCFISLVIIRLLQKMTGKRYSSEKILECLNRISCSHESENIYLFDYRSNLSDEIGKATGLDFTKKRLRLSDVKNIIASAKT
ncbi:MAG: transposase, partial [Oscillospiraceae bacterium]|nr:transposase [Oscillospiraceae bacterium]